MSLQSISNINQLLKQWPPGTVATSAWLKQQGISRQLAQVYKNSLWIRHIGHGAWIRESDSVDWQGALYAVQFQTGTPVHVGGKTALELFGLSHFVAYSPRKIFLFGPTGSKLPTWFKSGDWKTQISHTSQHLFAKAKELGIESKNVGPFAIKTSARERAILELLSLVPQKQEYEEALKVFEGLRAMRPDLLQSLLESCRSIKVKRLFLHLAELTEQPWLSALNLKRIKLGRGKRKIGQGGVFDSKYNISVPTISKAESSRELEGA